ncbi:MAG: 2-amino-4-hydroxy-6-hydroxymethyldihydropteridine diphosphokinase [Tenacibaculum sp.]
METQHITYLSLGSNIGDKFKNLKSALSLISVKIGSILKVASVYKSPSWGFKSKSFYNTCIKVQTELSVYKLMEKLLDIESELGRLRDNKKDYSDRIIDIDILLFNDKVIFSNNLIIPHPKMLERKFVLVPLAEIAAKVVHPTEKLLVSACLAKCKDNSDVKIIDKKLIAPISISQKYPFIAVEGNIGVGKTSLVKILSQEFNGKKVLERFADNPFLPKFYKNKQRYALALEMSFLADRYQQLTQSLTQYNLNKFFVVSDYYIFKSLIFAQITLKKNELNLYKRIFNIMYKEITKPSLYLYLYRNTDSLLRSIKNRGRVYEQNIKSEYLKKIEKSYRHFIDNEQRNLNVLVIDVTNMDFVNKQEDYQTILNQIKNH